MTEDRAKEAFEQIDATNEVVTKLCLILANALPHIEPEVAGLLAEFSRVIKETKDDYNKD